MVKKVLNMPSMLKSTGSTSKEGNITKSNSYAALVNDEDEVGEHDANEHDESANLFTNPNKGESSSFTVVSLFLLLF